MTGLGKRWPWILVLGILMLVTGFLALQYVVAATLASVVFIGTLLLIAGIAHVALALSSRGWRGVTLHLLEGLLIGAAGVVFLARPNIGAPTLTLVFAVMFLAAGSMRIASGVMQRFPHWGWSVANGVVTALLGVLVLASWPLSGIWFLGIYLGIDLIFAGASWIALSIALRRLTVSRGVLEPRTV